MLRRRNNGLSVYNPFREMDNFEKSFFGDPFDFFNDGALADFKTDITDEGDHYKLEADMPGFAKDDIHIEINDSTLTLSAERHSEHEDKDNHGKYIRCERSYGSFRRAFDISNVKADEIKAKYRNGVLTLTMPKKENIAPSGGKTLEIE